MKTMILTVALFVGACSASAQHDHNHGDTTAMLQSTTGTVKVSNLEQLLTSYYGIKDALVAGNITTASAQSVAFIKAANGIDYKVISEGNINALLKDVGAISKAKDLEKQREVFANLSENMVAIAKVISLSAQPVYQQYCPMKKANWLSSEQEIKNPYFGKMMLNCGEVVETFQPKQARQ